MLNNKYFYNNSIKNTLQVFGVLFSNIEIRRTDVDSNVIQNFKVPIVYSPRDKLLVRTLQQEDSTNEILFGKQYVQMGFELVDLYYDSDRKLNNINKVYNCNNEDGSYELFPVPYNLTIELNILSLTNSDILQVVEQILPNFQPSLTVTMNTSIGSIDVPIVLENISFQDSYDGSYNSNTREIIYTLRFTIKTYIFGIKETPINIPIKKINIYLNDIKGVFTPKATKDYNEDGILFDSNDSLIVDLVNSKFTLSDHGFNTQDKIQYRTYNNAPITPLVNDGIYYIIKIDNNNFKLAYNLLSSIVGNNIILSSYGQSDHRFSVINSLDDELVVPSDQFDINIYWS